MERLESVPHEVVERIKIIQPFMRPPEEKARDPLLLLQELSNLDKHRSSIIATAVPDQVAHNLSVQFEDDAAAERNVPLDVTLHLPEVEDGALLVEQRTLDPIVKLTGSWRVTLGVSVETSLGRQPLFEAMGGLIGYVGQVLRVIYFGAVKESDPDPDHPWVPYEPRKS